MTVVFGAHGAIPEQVPLRARFQYSFTVSNPRNPRSIASVSAILLHRGWMIEVRDGDRYNVLTRRPTIAGDVLEIVLDPPEIPMSMRGPFRWHALSEWAPDPAHEAPQVFSDFCPNAGFPRFGGKAT